MRRCGVMKVNRGLTTQSLTVLELKKAGKLMSGKVSLPPHGQPMRDIKNRPY